MAHLIAELRCTCGYGALGHHAMCSRREEGDYVARIDNVIVRSTARAVRIAGPLRPLVDKLAENSFDPRAAKHSAPVLLLQPIDAKRLMSEPTPEASRPRTVLNSKACPDCNGTGQYVGLGFSPAEDCKRCAGHGRVPKNEVAAIKFETIAEPLASPPKWLIDLLGSPSPTPAPAPPQYTIAPQPAAAGPIVTPRYSGIPPMPAASPAPLAPTPPAGWPKSVPWPGAQSSFAGMDFSAVERYLAMRTVHDSVIVDGSLTPLHIGTLLHRTMEMWLAQWPETACVVGCDPTHQRLEPELPMVCERKTRFVARTLAKVHRF